MLLEVCEERVTVPRELEEVVLFSDPVGGGSMDRALPFHEILLLLERLARHAVPPLVEPLVQIAALRDALHHPVHRRPRPRLGRPDEVVERHAQPRPHRTELLLHLVAVREGVESQLLGALVDVL